MSVNRRRLRARTAVVVDDEPEIARLVAECLQSLGFQARTAETGAAALQAIEAAPPQLVVLDVVLTDVSGLTVLEQIRQSAPDMAILMMTAFGSEQIAVEALRLGADDYLRKPFELEDLHTAVWRALGRFQARLRRQASLERLSERAVRLEQEAVTDALTGLPNRRAFERDFKRLSGLARRHGSHFSLLLIDVDNFKTVNDTHGHRAGDEVLRYVAAVLTRRARETDVVVRLGGDEFALLLPHTSSAEAHQLAEDLVRQVKAELITMGSGAVQVTISAGVAGSAEGGDVLNRADEALYRAKEQGRDRALSAAEGSA